MTQYFIDSHCHLADSDFDSDREQVIERARAAGVKHFVLIGTGADWQEISAGVSIAQRYEEAYCAAGIHPHEAPHFLESDFDELRSLARQPKFLGIGEIGLDYHYDHSSPDAQREILIRQLELARELALPVIIHCREAWADLREILRQQWSGSGLGGILHCFTGSRDDAFELLDAGFLVSFAGNLTFKKSDALRQAAKEIPLDRLLTETDSPYLAPVPHRGRRNEPGYVEEVLRQLAALRGLSEAEMAVQVLGNFKRFFRVE
ncbi:MAG: TatD family hydrolase [Terriglobia bacterium]